MVIFYSQSQHPSNTQKIEIEEIRSGHQNEIERLESDHCDKLNEEKSKFDSLETQHKQLKVKHQNDIESLESKHYHALSQTILHYCFKLQLQQSRFENKLIDNDEYHKSMILYTIFKMKLQQHDYERVLAEADKQKVSIEFYFDIFLSPTTAIIHRKER